MRFFKFHKIEFMFFWHFFSLACKKITFKFFEIVTLIVSESPCIRSVEKAADDFRMGLSKRGHNGTRWKPIGGIESNWAVCITRPAKIFKPFRETAIERNEVPRVVNVKSDFITLRFEVVQRRNVAFKKLKLFCLKKFNSSF